ncbi:hypothetical protein KL86SPO_31209 [uncultured Sporomusa sp.]|uniref:Uncharacterized protein n=1 Tax=uncultured Sporomusa sp. TaxID=307249 RepID=A0A212LU93_9FIRM|nr:hypothetical protein KL86SPO_31209 [uncultured Sporomusa sp.]
MTLLQMYQQNSTMRYDGKCEGQEKRSKTSVSFLYSSTSFLDLLHNAKYVVY